MTDENYYYYFLMGTFLFCFMFLLNLAIFSVLVVSASVDVGAALVQNWVDVLCSKLITFIHHYCIIITNIITSS